MASMLAPETYRKPRGRWYLNGYVFCAICHMALDRKDCIGTEEKLKCPICKQRVGYTPKHKCGIAKNRPVARVD